MASICHHSSLKFLAEHSLGLSHHLENWLETSEVKLVDMMCAWWLCNYKAKHNNPTVCSKSIAVVGSHPEAWNGTWVSKNCSSQHSLGAKWGRNSAVEIKPKSRNGCICYCNFLTLPINKTQLIPSAQVPCTNKLWTIICFHVVSVYNQSLQNHFPFPIVPIYHKFKRHKINSMSILGGYELPGMDLCQMSNELVSISLGIYIDPKSLKKGLAQSMSNHLPAPPTKRSLCLFTVHQLLSLYC